MFDIHKQKVNGHHDSNKQLQSLVGGDKHWWGMEKSGLLYTANGQLLHSKASKLKTYKPAILFLGMCPKARKAGSLNRYLNTHACIIHNSQNDRMNSKQYVLYLHIYWNIAQSKILRHATTWINLTNITLSETNQSQKSKYYMTQNSDPHKGMKGNRSCWGLTGKQGKEDMKRWEVDGCDRHKTMGTHFLPLNWSFKDGSELGF